jgi:hypothetical protein
VKPILVVLLASFSAATHLSSTDPGQVDRPLIVIRGDRADSAYVALARRFNCVGSFGRIGVGTLIDPEWVVTAAHVARAVMRRSPAPAFIIGGRKVAVSAVYLHPEWKDLGDHDIALVRLARAVTDVMPAALYTEHAEAGQVVYLVGNGRTGIGGVRERHDDGLWRAATSLVDSVSSESLFLSFDTPPGGTAYEGAPSAGDSGGPALIDLDGRMFVAGISSAGFDGLNGPASYGSIDVYTRVAAQKAWTDSVKRGLVQRAGSASDGSLPQRRQRRSATRGDTSLGAALPGTASGVRAKAFVLAMRAGSDSALLAFLRTNFAEAELRVRTAEARLPNFRRLAEQLGKTRVIKVSNSTESSITIELTTGGPRPMIIELVCEPVAPFKIIDWRRFD